MPRKEGQSYLEWLESINSKKADEIVEMIKQNRSINPSSLLSQGYTEDEIWLGRTRYETDVKNKAIADAFNRGDIKSIFFDYE